MSASRWDALARILIEHSTRTSEGDRVLIVMTEPETFPFARAVYGHAVRVGAFPQVQLLSALLERDLLSHGNAGQVERTPDLELSGIEWADVYIGLRGFRNPSELADFPAPRLAAHRRAIGLVSAARTGSTRWVLVRVPGEALAQHAGLPTDVLVDGFFAASVRDWSSEREHLRRLAERFEAGAEVRLVGAGTDLTFSTRGRRYVLGDGTHNIPDGEIYTAPVDESARGHVTFEFPGLYGGTRIEGIRLEFEAGRVLEATARSGQELLREVLAIDDGASRIGEFGIGTNQGLTRFSGDILYDEKIGGTIHLALGRAYAECGGTNRSAVHWDLVKDLRTEGAILLDGSVVFERGAWLGGQ
jgi:aminopeptidase